VSIFFNPLATFNFELIDELTGVFCKIQNLALNLHSGQAQRGPELRIIKYFWIPASAGMTE